MIRVAAGRAGFVGKENHQRETRRLPILQTLPSPPGEVADWGPPAGAADRSSSEPTNKLQAFIGHPLCVQLLDEVMGPPSELSSS